MKLIKTNSFKVHHVVCCCYHSNHNDWFSNLLLLFLKMSHADLYLQAFWSIYWIGQILVIREPSPLLPIEEIFNYLNIPNILFKSKIVVRKNFYCGAGVWNPLPQQKKSTIQVWAATAIISPINDITYFIENRFRHFRQNDNLHECYSCFWEK